MRCLRALGALWPACVATAAVASVDFDGTTGNISRNTGTPPITGYPASAFCWYKRTADSASSMIALGQDSPSVLNKFALAVTGAGVPQARRTDGTSANNASAAAGDDDTNVWHSVLGVFESTTSALVYHDGGDVGTSSTSKTVSAFTEMFAGGDGDDTSRLTGRLAHCAWWSSVLDATDAANLHAGDNPLTVEAGTLEIYWPMTNASDAGEDVIAGYDITLTGDAAYNADNPTVDDPPSACSGTPVITDVDSDESLSATQANFTITGTDFCDTQDTGSVTLRQNGNTKTISGCTWSDTSLTNCDMSGVGKNVTNGLRYGAMDLRVTNDGGNSDDQAITVTAESGAAYVDIGTALTLAWDEYGIPNRVYGTPTDLADGDQLAVDNAVGCTLATDVTLNNDGSLTVDEACTSVDAAYTASDLYPGTDAAQTFTGLPVLFGQTPINDRTLVLDATIAPIDYSASFIEGDEPIASYAYKQFTTTTSRTQCNGAQSDTLFLVVDSVTGLVRGDYVIAGSSDPVRVKYVDPFTPAIGLWSATSCADNDAVDEQNIGNGAVSGLSLNAGTGELTGASDTEGTVQNLFVRATDDASLDADSNDFDITTQAALGGSGKRRVGIGLGIRL